jgi:hypothetical protein
MTSCSRPAWPPSTASRKLARRGARCFIPNNKAQDKTIFPRSATTAHRPLFTRPFATERRTARGAAVGEGGVGRALSRTHPKKEQVKDWHPHKEVKMQNNLLPYDPEHLCLRAALPAGLAVACCSAAAAQSSVKGFYAKPSNLKLSVRALRRAEQSRANSLLRQKADWFFETIAAHFFASQMDTWKASITRREGGGGG